MATSPCPHIGAARLSPPRAVDVVHREECTQCFDTADGENGIDVCLACFNGGCPSTSERHHAQTHAERWGAQHVLAVNVKRRRRPVVRKPASDEPPPPKKLAIREEAPEHEKYDFSTSARCYACDPLGRDLAGTPGVDRLDGVIAGVMSSMSSAQKSEVKAWEEEITSCGHCDHLEQDPPRTIEPAGLAHCASCELTNNLWLCLTCGALGCGRQQFGGTGGNGHAKTHYSETMHPLAVKLGTIEPEGNADIYCYLCDDARLDPHLAKHLSTFGIHVADQRKTEKSMTELQVEQNLVFDFAMTGEDGKDLEPLAGPSLTGLRNLGNSCYINSVLQALFSLPSFASRYLLPFATHPLLCSKTDPATCLDCQMHKLADGLLSGRYAKPREAVEGDESTPTGPAFQEGIRPSMFKALVGKGHPEFATMRQQDADEFLRHLFKSIQRSLPPGANAVTAGVDEVDPTLQFRFAMEQRLSCNSCGGVRYRIDEQDAITIPVPAVEKPSAAAPMDVDGADGKAKASEPVKVEYESVKVEECLDILTRADVIEYKCPSCNKAVSATKTMRFATFPDTLILHAARFIEVGYVPRKVDVPVLVPVGEGEALSLDPFVGKGLQPGETELPADAEEPVAVPAGPQFDAAALEQLQGMGFPLIRCQRALLAVGNPQAGGAETAMNWLFEHMEDPDIDAPLPAASGSAAASSSAEPSAESISAIVDMGFTPAQARKALRETGGGALDRAMDWIFSHPDDAGDDDSGASTSTAGASTSAGPSKPQAGSASLPASYRLKAVRSQLDLLSLTAQYVSHKGPSVHSGHYVAHVRQQDGRWALFNDEKVVRADGGAQSAAALAPLAYVYVFERV